MAPRVPLKSGEDILKTFHRAASFQITFKRRGKGSHVVLANRNGETFVVPMKKQVKRGLLEAIILQAGMTIDEFLEYDP